MYIITATNKNGFQTGDFSTVRYGYDKHTNFIARRRKHAKDRGWSFRKLNNLDIWIMVGDNCTWLIEKISDKEI